MENLGKVCQADCHFDTQDTPEFDVLVEPGREVGHGILDSLGVGKCDLHGVDVPNAPQQRQVHREELADEALQLLDQYAALGGGY